jgi:hypothetical protein
MERSKGKAIFMKIIKRSALLIIAMMTLLGVSGCMNESDNSMSEGKKQAKLTEKLLHEKYGKEFVVYSLGNSWGTLTNNTFTALCYEKGASNVRFRVKVVKDGSYMSDEYISCKVSGKIEKRMMNVLQTSTLKMALKLGPEVTTIKSSDSDMEPEEFMKQMPNTLFALYVVIDANNLSNEEATQIVDVLNKSVQEFPALNGAIDLYLGNRSMIDRFNQYNCENPGADHGMFEILKDAKNGLYKIENNKVQLTAEELLRLSSTK